MLKNNISSKFLVQLNNDQLTLDERLDLAYGAIISQDFFLSNKGQIIFDWFANLLKANLTQVKAIFKTFTKCLNSECFSTLSDSIDASNIFVVYEELDEDVKIKYNKQLVNNILLILRNPGFQRYCRFDIQPLCKAALLICSLMRLHSKENADALHTNSVLEDLFESLNNIHKITQQRTELKVEIVKYIVPALLTSKIKIQLSKNLQTLFDEVILAEDIENLCNAFKINAPKGLPDHYKALVKLMTENQQGCNVVMMYPLLFDAYTYSILKTSKSATSHLSLFYILLNVVGFESKLPYDTVKASDEILGLHLTILKELVGVLQKHNISTFSESEEGILSVHLIAIQKKIISQEYTLTPELLKAVNNLFNVCPESVRPLFSNFCLHIAFVKKNDKLLKTYNKLLTDVVKMFSKLNQMEKLFNLLFENADKLSKQSNLSKVSTGMILTEGFYLALSEKLPTLTGNQLKIILAQLGKEFSKNIASLLNEDSFQDPNYYVLMKLITQVLNYILENSFFIVSKRWNLISSEISNVIESIQTFGHLTLKWKATDFILEFLQLVKTVADIELMINQYIILQSTTKILPAVHPKDNSYSREVYTLSKSHGFIYSKDWKHISKIVSESYTQELKHCWYDLLLQKYLRMSDPEVITHLVLNADHDWLWKSLGRMSACVPLKHLELYTDQLFGSLDDLNDHLGALDDLNVISNRPLRVTINFQCLKQLSQMIQDETALSGNLLKLLDVYTVIQFEAEWNQNETDKQKSMMNMIDALTEYLNTSLWEQPVVDFTDEAKEHFQRLIDFINVMSPYCLKSDTRRIIFLVLMGLANDLKSEESLLHSVLEIILGCLDDIGTVIPDSLDRRVLLQWLATVVPDSFPLRSQLSQLTIDTVVYSFNQSVQEMSQVVQENCDLLFTLLTAHINVLGSKGYKGKEEFNKSLKYLISLATPLITKKPKAKYIMLFTKALKAEISILNLKAPTLVPLLQNYLDILFKRFADNMVIEPNSTELIDLTLSMRSELDPGVVEQTYKSITEELCKTELCPILCYPTTVRTFVESLPTDSFENTLSEIYKHQREGLLQANEISSVSNMCEFWAIVVISHLDKEKGATRQKMLIKVLEDYQCLLAKDPTRIHAKVLNLLYSISVSKSVILASKLLDLILVILQDIPTDTETHLLPESLAVMSVLISGKSELILDRIPAYLQRLRKFIKSLMLLSSERDDHLVYNDIITNSMNQVTRIIKTITDHHSKHFARIAPYLIADLLNLLVTISVDTSVKEELQNCVCWLLSTCDHHSTLLLQNLLPIDSVQLYKLLASTYNKSFKYTGKV